VIGVVVFFVVASAGAAAIATVLRTTVDEAAALREEMRRLGELQPALVAVRQEAARTADAVKHMRSR
jgi:hypothetical protein